MTNKQEKIHRTLKDTNEPKSRAVRVRMLLKKNSAIFRDKQKITDFKEPILMLIRRSRAVEFYEDASKGVFSFTHSDGKYRELYLEPSSQVSFDYGKRKFKGYLAFEDTPLPLPEMPLITADVVNMILEKSMMDLKKLNERKDEMKLKTIKLLAWIIGGAVVLFILYKTGVVDRLIDMVLGKQNTPTPAPVEGVTGQNALAITSSILLAVYRDIKKDWERVRKKVRKWLRK